MTTSNDLECIVERARRIDSWSWDLALTRHRDPDVERYAAEVHILALDAMELAQRMSSQS
jgi:hypothetical protein